MLRGSGPTMLRGSGATTLRYPGPNIQALEP